MMTHLRTILLGASALFLAHSFSFGQSAVLRPGDSFEMRLGGIPIEYAQDFAISYTVYDDGMIGVPLIGSVKAAGLSVGQLAKSVEQKLISEKIFTSPTVSITQQAQSRTVTIGGAVRVPQGLMWTSDLTLSAGIKRAGGFGDFGSKKKVKLIRGGKATMYNLTKADKDPSQNPKLLPGDEVEVSE